LSYLITFTFIYFSEKTHARTKEDEKLFKISFRQYMKVAVCLFVYLAILLLDLYGFEYAPDVYQRIIPAFMFIVTFIVRKIILSLADPFPIEMAMLIAGFWVQNMYDMLLVIAYPAVRVPSTYIVIWFTNFGTNVANLVFVTNHWFTFRVWIKAFLSECFHGKINRHPKGAVAILEDDPEDRGHSNNKPGYYRRQVRFYLWKILSQLFAIIFYFTMSIFLRYGDNQLYYPFSDKTGLTLDNYQHSIIYNSANFFAVCLAGIAGVLLVRFKMKPIWEQLVKVHGRLLINHVYLGFVVAIVANNGVMAISMIMYHNRLWYAYRDIGAVSNYRH